MSKSISGLHDPYEDQLAAARYRAERDALAQAMQRVADSMREHALGVEGMEGSPVAGWERELRAALGGLENIGTMIGYRRVLNGVCKRLGLTDGTGMPEQDGVIYEALDRRLMPEGMEWPRYESGEPVPIGGEFMGKDGKTYSATQIQFIGKCFSLYDFCDRKPQFNGFYGETVKRPAVLAADGEPLEVGQVVYHIESGDEFTVTGVDAKRGEANLRWGYDFEAKTGSCAAELLTHRRPVLDADGNRIEPAMDVWWVCEGDGRGVHAEKLHVESIGDDGFVTCSPFNGGTWVELEPSELYVNKSVLDADGVPIREWDTVWNATTSAGPFTVREIERSDDPDEPEDIVWCGEHAANGFKVWRIADQLTHTKPEPIDTWQRIEEDAGCTATKYNERRGTIFTTKQQVARDLVRRCRALAERERGE